MRVELRDGRFALIAALGPDDRRRYVTGFERLGAEALYRRFMTPVTRLTESQLRYLLAVDHRDHEALLAVDEESGEAIGIARFVRSSSEPDLAEAAIIVVEAWQQVGLGTALLRQLAARAAELGVGRFEATVLRENRPMLALLDALGPVRNTGSEGSAMRAEVDL